jgi:nitrile hydratase accessory protein
LGVIAASMSFRIPWLRHSVTSRSTCIPCALQRRSFGVRTPVESIPSTRTCRKIILNQHDSVPDSGNLAALPRLPRDAGGPVFAEPWQAQAFALAVRLSKQGHFTWTEWAAALSEELKLDAARGEADDGSRYYQCWLAALERLVVSKNLSSREALSARKEAWADAYRHTPHGKPVELEHEI